MVDFSELMKSGMDKAAPYKSRLFLYVTQYEGDVIVRYVGTPQPLYQYFNKDPHSPETRKPFYKMTDTGDSNCHITLRVASFVIDREDEKIRAFISPISVWQQVEKYLNHDFRIRREGKMLQTKYIVERLEQTELTEEQIKMVAATQDAFSFEHIYANKEKWEILTKKQETIESRFDIMDL